MKSKFTFIQLLTVSFVCFLAISSFAQQTKKISLQGFLKDGNGKAVADGAQDITFKLYTVAVGGTAAWTESQTINVFGGVYSTHLGSIANPLDNLNWGSATYYVGVTVQGIELTPRTELTFAPYSLGSPKSQEVVCSGAVGDVKYSILNPTQFAAVNGECWVAMKGGSIAGSKLATLTGMTSIPDAGGLFIRSQEFAGGADRDPDRNSNSAIATFQDHALQTHSHPFSGNTSTNGEHQHSYSLPYRREEDGWGADRVSAFKVTDRPLDANMERQTEPAGSHSHTFSGHTGNNSGNPAMETRPKNLNLWVYIRIN